MTTRFGTIILACLVLVLPLAAQPTLRPPMPKVALPIQDKIDLTTPAATIRSFGAAINRYEFAQMAQCVADTKGANAEQATLLMGQLKKVSAQIYVSEPRVRVQGNLASASFYSQAKLNFGPGKPPVEQPAQPERMLLRLNEGQWKVVPNLAMLTAPGQQAAPGPTPGMELGDGFLTMVATYIANPEIMNRAANGAQQGSCINNLKQLALASIQLAQDSDEIFAFTKVAQKLPAANAANIPALLDKPWQKALWAYAKAPQIFFCPLRAEPKPDDAAKANEQARRDKLMDDAGMPRAGEPYALNENLDGLKLGDIVSPAETVLFYEGRGGKLDFRHDGLADVAFCDGHVVSASPEDAKKMIWTVQAPNARIKAE